MPINYKCPKCGRSGKTRDDLAGRIVKCPGCDGSIELPPAMINHGQRQRIPDAWFDYLAVFVALTIGIIATCASTASLIGRQFRDALGNLSVIDDAIGEAIGLLIGACCLAGGLISLARRSRR